MFEAPSPDAIVVQKYGGTSVGSAERIRNVARRIAAQQKRSPHRIAVVVSAMSGETNRLVDLVQQVNPEASALSYDMTVAAGEQVSVGLTCAALEGEGLKAVPLTGLQLGIRTDKSHSKARIQHIATEKIESCWKQGIIPVVAGFQGMTEDMSLTTLGRGGSDTSAVALAVALKAQFCEINTDVSGVYTADPRVVPNAKLIERIDYSSCLELAVLGGKVLHPRCVELAAKYQMPLIVRSTFDSDDARRTLVNFFNEQDSLESPVVSAVTIEKRLAKFSVQYDPKQPASFPEIFDLLSRASVNIDIIVYDRRESEHSSIGFSVSTEADIKKAHETLKAWSQGKGVIVDTRRDLAKVSVIGLGMQTHSGVASRIFDTLGRHQIDVIMVSTSEIKVSCVVPESQADLAARELHKTFLE